MATVINLPPDRRFEALGRGLGNVAGAFQRKRRSEAFQEAVGGLSEDATIPEIVDALSEFLSPEDVASLLAAPALAKAKRVPEKTPEQIREEAEARRGGTLAAEAAEPSRLLDLADKARKEGNPRRAKVLERQVEKQTGKSPKTIREEAAAREQGTFDARMRGMEAMISAARGETGVEISDIEIFSGKGRTSPAARMVAGLLTQAHFLNQVGQTTQANALLREANILMNNDPELIRRKELSKPISPALAARLQVPTGTSLGEVADIVPMSPIEEAAAISEARARGTGKVEAEVRIGFGDEGKTLINDLIGKIEKDPGLVGARGSLRATGKTAVGVLKDLGFKDFVDTAKRIALDSERSADEIDTLFSDPTLSVLGILENSIGMILARMRVDTKRIPVDVIRRSIDDVKLKGIIASEQVVDRLRFIDSLIDLRKENLEDVFGLGGEVSGRYRIEGGTLIRVE